MIDALSSYFLEIKESGILLVIKISFSLLKYFCPFLLNPSNLI